MDLNTFLRENADSLGETWFGPSSLRDLIEADRVGVAGTDNAVVLEFTWDDDRGHHVECWTLPEASQLDKFH